jgi:hypothetical protein
MAAALQMTAQEVAVVQERWEAMLLETVVAMAGTVYVLLFLELLLGMQAEVPQEFILVVLHYKVLVVVEVAVTEAAEPTAAALNLNLELQTPVVAVVAVDQVPEQTWAARELLF